MKPYSRLLLRTMCAALLVGACAVPILSQQARNKAAARAASSVRFRQSFHTNSGIVILGYGEQTNVTIVDGKGNVVKSASVGNTNLLQIPLKEGSYQLQADDGLVIVASDLNAYNTKMLTGHFGGHNPPINVPGAKKPSTITRAPVRSHVGPAMTVLPVPWVADSTYATNTGAGPSSASRHVVFDNVPTRLKVVVNGGTAPYSVAWNPGDGSAVQTITSNISTSVTAETAPNTFFLPVGSIDGLVPGDTITIGNGPNQETNTVNYVAEENNTNLQQNADSITTVLGVNYAFVFNDGDTINLGQIVNRILSGFPANAQTVSGNSPSGDQPPGTNPFIVNSLAGFSVGDSVTIDPTGTPETVTVASLGSFNVVSGGNTTTYYTLTFTSSTTLDHVDGVSVVDNNQIQAGNPQTAVAGFQSAGTFTLGLYNSTAFNDGDSVTLYSTVENTSETLVVAPGGGSEQGGGLVTFTTPTSLDYNDGDAVYNDFISNAGGRQTFVTSQPSANTIAVNSVQGYNVGDNVYLQQESGSFLNEFATVASVGPGSTITFISNLQNAYNANDSVQDYSGVLVTTQRMYPYGFGVNTSVRDLNVQVDLASPLQFTHSAGDPVVTQSGAKVGVNGCTLPWTYTLPVGSLVHASVTITDSNNATGTADYWIRVGDPANQTDRVARSSDEALWYLHTEMNRQDGVSNPSARLGGNEPAVNEGYIAQFETAGVTGTYNGTINDQGGVTIAPSSMFAIALENSGHSIEGGVNFSHQAAKDAYVDDLSRLINYLTDTNTLTDVAPGYQPPTDDGNVTYPPVSFMNKMYSSGAVLNPVDTHWTGAGTPYVLVSNTSRVIYEGGMHLQAIAQAGFADEAVPNRSEYPSFYNLIGGFVDGFQYSQAVGIFAGNGDTFTSEGGWRYDFGYGDADGSAVAWAVIGLASAEHAYALTPGGAPGSGPYSTPILVDPIIRSELKIWLAADQITPFTNYTQGNTNYNTGAIYNFNTDGGLGYVFQTYGPNSAKTGGGLEAFAFAGEFDTGAALATTLANETHAEDYLYRNFYTNDYTFGWNSSRDAYGMYNMFKGLTDLGVTNLVQSATPEVVDSPGNTVTSIPWYGQFADFIAGSGQNVIDNNSVTYLDLGHQAWPGNSLDPLHVIHPSSGMGHYEPSSSRTWAVGPLPFGEWNYGNSDWDADVNLDTAWEVAILMGQVFTAGPVANFGHPTGSETTVPETVNGLPFKVTFDPGGSTELNPAGTITSVTWNFGDGSAPVSYNLASTGGAGGTVPLNIAGNQTQHGYTVSPLPATVTISLTVFDNQGLSNTKTENLTIENGVATPVARFSGASTDSRQSGNTIGIIDAGPNTGFVTIQFDGSASSNPNPAGVVAPDNSNGISNFAWQWTQAPMSTTTSDTPPSVNPGGAVANPNLFNQGVLDMSGLLNSGSKAPLQTYTFYFGNNPATWPTSIQVGLQVQSNLPTPPGMPNNTNTVVKVFNLLPNSQMPVTALQIRNLTLHNITDTTAVISFDTTDPSGVPVASTGAVNYGLTPGYGSTVNDAALKTHHDITVTGLTANTLYYYDVTAAGGTQTATSPGGMFTTLFTGLHITITQASVSNQGNGVITVTWQATNTGTLSAPSFKVSAFGASLATVTSVNGNPPGGYVTPPVTLVSGGTTQWTVVYHLTTPTEAFFFGKFTDACTGYSATQNIEVKVP